MTELQNWLILYFIISILTGCFAANQAHEKNRDIVGWFILGFVLGVLGVAIISVASSIEKTSQDDNQAKQYDEDNLVLCPFCAEKIKSKALICRYCNRPISNSVLNEEQDYEVDVKKRMWEKLIEIEGEKCIRFARKQSNLWECVCGRNNLPESESCLKCNSNRDHILRNCTKDAIYKIV